MKKSIVSSDTWYVWCTGVTRERLRLIGKGIEYLLQLSLLSHTHYIAKMYKYSSSRATMSPEGTNGRKATKTCHGRRSTFPTLEIRRWKTFDRFLIENVSILMSSYSSITIFIYLKTEFFPTLLQKTPFRGHSAIPVKVNKSWNGVSGFVFHFN